MSENQPLNTDAILGGQNPPPVNAAVLGGVAGTKHKLDREFGKVHEIFSFETISVNDRAEIINRTQKQAYYYTEK
jgi:hypothetical protein